jgi:acetyltransferase-like isoleucine patch superfamily enzyme
MGFLASDRVGSTKTAGPAFIRAMARELSDARRSDGLAAWTYRRVVVSGSALVRGHLSLLFFQTIYKGFSCGPGARCWGKMLVVMDPGSSITIGSRFYAVSDARRAGIALYSPCKLRTMEGAELVIGDNVGLNGTSITCRGRIEIGEGVLVAANVVIMDSDFHRQWPPADRWDPTAGAEVEPVSIGRHVWIGVGSIILKGARIGDNSIIGAGSVVTGSIPSNVVAAGVPAKIVRRLGP